MTTNLLGRVVGWLRKGYPEGIPPKDFPPLLALLQRTLGPDEVQAVCRQVIADHPDGDIAREEVARAVEQIKSAPPNSEDVNAVAARLAAVGWPLSVPDERTASEAVPWPGLLERILGWLHEGYPEGVPPRDYIPILALLRRRLTDDEVSQVARELVREGDRTTNGTQPASAADVQTIVSRISGGQPSAEDLDRVQARLAAKGWPLDGL